MNDTEFARLAREKVIHADTLVWRHGMPEWKTYAEVEATLPAVELPPPMQAETSAEIKAAAAAILAAQPANVVYAGFWVRFLAKAVDLLILSALVMSVANAIGRLPTLPPHPDMNDIKVFVAEMSALSRVTFVIDLLYTFFFVWRFQGTPGKLLLGLKIVNPDGSRLKLIRILTRFLVEMVNRFLFSIGYLSAAFDPEKRTMHDFLCNTRVVKKQTK